MCKTSPPPSHSSCHPYNTLLPFSPPLNLRASKSNVINGNESELTKLNEIAFLILKYPYTNNNTGIDLPRFFNTSHCIKSPSYKTIIQTFPVLVLLCECDYESTTAIWLSHVISVTKCHEVYKENNFLVRQFNHETFVNLNPFPYNK